MTITALPTPPSSTDKTNFNSRADAFLAALVNFVTETNTTAAELNAAVAALNFNSTNSTSATSLTIGYGSKSLTVQTGKSYVVGMTLRIANTSDASKWMQSEVVSYDSGTGALVVNVTHAAGSGTLAVWTISLSSRISVPFTGNARTIVHTGNGVGSTNTKIRRFTTVLTDTLGAYADNAALGGTFTMLDNGIYSICYSDRMSVGGDGFGVSKNSTQLTTAFNLINEADKLIYAGARSADDLSGGAIVTYLTAGDVLRCHVNTGVVDAYAGVRMIIERLF
jgi:hypothetical protein